MDNNQKLVNSFHEALGINAALIVDSLEYQTVPEWDSISHMILISQLEEDFEVSIDTDDVIDMSSFAKAKDILSKYNIVF
ncbi:MAG: acyl carrier protein [Bacteroidetes bacterium]|nr:acyl carrier protein [Bacteroidota bacterium]